MRSMCMTVVAIATCCITGSSLGDFWNSPYVELTASDGSTGDAFGYSIAIDGDTCVISAIRSESETGSAYVYASDENGVWSQTAKLTASNGTHDDYFGLDVAIDGDLCVIGAYGTNSYTGSAYLYAPDENGDWDQIAELTASDGAIGDRFGNSVAIQGDTCMVGAYEADSQTGRVYIFRPDENGEWTQAGVLTASDGASGDYFGWKIAIDGTSCVIGAFGADSFAGSAYLFTADESGAWSEAAELTASGRESGDYFGVGVDLDDDTCVIGAFKSNDETGSAYLFAPDENGDWNQIAELTASDGTNDDLFGNRVAIDGNTCVIGAYGTESYTGSAYVFTADAAGAWNQIAKLNDPDAEDDDAFARSVAMDDGICLIGASGTNYITGSAYLYGSPPIQTGACCIGDVCEVIAESDCQGDWLGADTNCSDATCSVAPCIGDTNLDDVVNITDLLNVIEDWGDCEQPATIYAAEAWGQNDYGQSVVPADQQFVQVAIGKEHSLGLRADGTVIAWGGNVYGACDVPAVNFTQVSAGGYHSLGLRSDGTALAWGQNYYGQCDVPAGESFVQIVAGHAHSIGLRADGTAIAWGLNNFGQCDVPAGETFVEIVAGGYHNIGIRADGSTVAWGDNLYQQCNIPEGESFVQFDAGLRSSIGLLADGTALAWGNNSSGQCDVPVGETFVQVAAGALHSMGLRADGTVVAWGSNTWDQCEVPDDAVFDVILAGVHNSYGLTMQGMTVPDACEGDTNDDGVVEIGDLLIVIDGWGFCP